MKYDTEYSSVDQRGFGRMLQSDARYGAGGLRAGYCRAGQSALGEGSRLLPVGEQ